MPNKDWYFRIIVFMLLGPAGRIVIRDCSLIHVGFENCAEVILWNFVLEKKNESPKMRNSGYRPEIQLEVKNGPQSTQENPKILCYGNISEHKNVRALQSCKL